MARKYQQKEYSGSDILLIDDNLEYLEASKLLLQREGHRVSAASSGEKGLQLLKEKSFDLILVDYFMPGMTGEEMVRELRKFNELVQVILQTGYASEHPPRDLLQRLDIQGYFDKSDGPEKMLLWVDVGLKAAKTTQFLHHSRDSLNYILEVTPDLHKIQNLEELLKGILIQVMGLLGAGNSFLAVYRHPPKGKRTETLPSGSSNSFLAMLNEGSGLKIQAGTGMFRDRSELDEVMNSAELSEVKQVLDQGTLIAADNHSLIPLKVGDRIIGIIFLDKILTSDQDKDLLEIFANQAAVAIHNSRLFEFATVDPLSGVYVRGFFQQCLLRELRNADRSQENLTILMVDIDDLKIINDTHGHLAGDEALVKAGQALKASTRNTDYIGRYGGDEFIIMLPRSTEEGNVIVLDRIAKQFQDQTVGSEENPIPLKCSIGIATLQSSNRRRQNGDRPTPQEYYEEMAKVLIEEADAALYCKKKDGKNGYHFSAQPVSWMEKSGY